MGGYRVDGKCLKGVYPQYNGSLAIADIDASKGFVNLWVHLALAIFANFDIKNY